VSDSSGRAPTVGSCWSPGIAEARVGRSRPSRYLSYSTIAWAFFWRRRPLSVSMTNRNKCVGAASSYGSIDKTTGARPSWCRSQNFLGPVLSRRVPSLASDAAFTIGTGAPVTPIADFVTRPDRRCPWKGGHLPSLHRVRPILLPAKVASGRGKRLQRARNGHPHAASL
jgi:hypothetical protein